MQVITLRTTNELSDQLLFPLIPKLLVAHMVVQKHNSTGKLVKGSLCSPFFSRSFIVHIIIIHTFYSLKSIVLSDPFGIQIKPLFASSFKIYPCQHSIENHSKADFNDTPKTNVNNISFRFSSKPYFIDTHFLNLLLILNY